MSYDVVERFLAAFERLDLDAFMDCFAPDATAFFPEPEPNHRHDGREAIRARFAEVFAGIGSHRLEPQDLAVQPLTEDTAVVTFHLRNDVRTARRTLVVHRNQVIH